MQQLLPIYHRCSRAACPVNSTLASGNRPQEAPQQQLVPFQWPPIYDQLEPRGKIKDYKEGGATVRFESFNGHNDRTKALTFIQQFDIAYTQGLFSKASKIRKASTFLEVNALQWWSNLLMQGKAPLTWVDFKRMFAANWLTSTCEVDVMT